MKKNLLPLFACLFLLVPACFAGSATWSLEGLGGPWNFAPAWTPNVIPNSPDDIATFGTSTATDVYVSSIDVGSMVFTPGASAYSFTAASNGLSIYGPGIVNDSGTVQNFVTIVPYGSIYLVGTASAGSGTVFRPFPAGIQASQGAVSCSMPHRMAGAQR